MARPAKTGLDYFPHDVGLSSADNIEAIEELYGNDGYAVYLKLLERIYKNGGKFFIADDETAQRLYRKFRLKSQEILIKIINSMVKVGLFDKKAWEESKMLTSSRIRRTLKTVVVKRVKAKENYRKKVSASET